MEEKLLDFVLDQLDACKGTWPQVAEKTGLEYSWLTKLAQRKIPDPSVNKIQRLSDFFKATGKDRRVKSQDRREATA